jgi:hypothetical protein
MRRSSSTGCSFDRAKKGKEKPGENRIACETTLVICLAVKFVFHDALRIQRNHLKAFVHLGVHALLVCV